MFPKQSEIELPVLKCVAGAGGRAKPSEIFSLVTELFPNLSPADLDAKLPSSANKWRNCIAWVRQKLISVGELESPERGLWAITEKGRKRLASPDLWRGSSKTSAKSTSPLTAPNIERLRPIGSRAVKSEFRARLKQIESPEIDFENKVWTLVHGLLPTDITTGRDPEIRLASETFRPDLVAFFDESIALIVECKLTSSDAFVANWISQCRTVKRSLEEALRATGRKQFVYVLAIEDKQALKAHVKSSAEQVRIKLIDQREIEYFSTLHKTLGIGVRHLFWGRVAAWVVRQKEERLPALRVKLGKRRDVYIFSVNAHDMLSRSFVSHRELHSPEEGLIGFQRMFQKQKLGEITKYIERFKVFPTPIVVAFRKSGTAVFEPLPASDRAPDSMKGEMEFGHIKPPKEPDSIQIIDGQHRLYGYSGLPKSDEHVVHVVAYKTAEAQDLATMFVDINSKQTRVPSSLLWELYPDICGEDDPEYYRAVISRVVERVAKSQLQGFVRHISSGMKGEISFHTLCTEVKRAHLYERGGGLLQTESDLRNVLDAFFAALSDLGQRFARVNQAFVFSNNGIAPFIRTMGRIVKYEIGHNHEANLRTKRLLIETFRSFFEPVYQHYSVLGETRLRALRKERIGNAGSNTTEDEITEQIQTAWKPDFPYRPKKIHPVWHTEVQRFAALAANINSKATDSGRLSSWVFGEFNPDRLKKRLLKPIDGPDTFGAVLTALYNEVIEGTGKDATENRLARLMNVPRLYDLEPIAKLNTLRTYWEHKTGQVDAKKRQLAVQALAELSDRPSLGVPSELDQSDYQKIATALVRMISEKVLTPALQALSAP